MTDWVIPCLLAGVAAAAMGRRTDVYGALTDGAAEGLRVLGRILPALVVLLSAVQMFRASGAMELLTGLLSPVLEGLGIPPETAVLLLVALLSAQHFTDLAQILQSKRIVSFPTAAFLALVWGINHQRSLTIAMALVFAIPAIASIVMGFKVKPTGANEAIARTHIAFRRRAKAAGAFSLVAMICVTVALTYGVAQTQKVVTLSPPEDYSLADGVATIKFSQISDGHLHRFEYRAKDGTSMRFIIIKKNGGAYGIGLDACENCGDAGYYERTARSSARSVRWPSTWRPSASRAGATRSRSRTRPVAARSPFRPPTWTR